MHKFLKRFSKPLGPACRQAGFTQIELMVAIGISAILLSVITINLVGSERKASLSSEVNQFIADLKEQQIKAMVGDGEGTGGSSNYGLRIETTKYTLFRGTYGATNYAVTLPPTIQITTTFTSPGDLIFQKGNGNINYTAGSNKIVLTDTTTNNQKEIYVNKYGVIEQIISLP